MAFRSARGCGVAVAWKTARADRNAPDKIGLMDYNGALPSTRDPECIASGSSGALHAFSHRLTSSGLDQQLDLKAKAGVWGDETAATPVWFSWRAAWFPK